MTTSTKTNETATVVRTFTSTRTVTDRAYGTSHPATATIYVRTSTGTYEFACEGKRDWAQALNLAEPGVLTVSIPDNGTPGEA